MGLPALFAVAAIGLVVCSPATGATPVPAGPPPVPFGSPVPSAAAPMHVSLLLNPSSIDFGASSNLTASVSGGTPWYVYNWTELPVGCSPSNRSSLNCTPTQRGTFTVTVIVNDSTGKGVRASKTLSVGVTPPASPLFGWNPFTVFVLAGGIGVAAAVATTVVIVGLRRRRPPGKTPLVAVSPHPYVPPASDPVPGETGRVP